MSTTRDALRSLTVGAPKRQFRMVLVPLRDELGERVKELAVDPVTREPVMVPVLDAKGEPVCGLDGLPLKEQATVYRFPVRKDANGLPVQVEVREAGSKDRGAILRAGKVDKDHPERAEFEQMKVEACLRCAYVPGTNTRVFEEADRQSLLAQPPGGFVDDISEVAISLLQADKETVEKNS